MRFLNVYFVVVIESFLDDMSWVRNSCNSMNYDMQYGCKPSQIRCRSNDKNNVTHRKVIYNFFLLLNLIVK